MFHGQVNGQVICFFTRSFDLAWPVVAPPLELTLDFRQIPSGILDIENCDSMARTHPISGKMLEN